MNDYELTWDELMQRPDSPEVARLRQTRETGLWLEIGCF